MARKNNTPRKRKKQPQKLKPQPQKRKKQSKKVWYVTTSVDHDVDYSDKLFRKKVISILKHPKGWEHIDSTVKFKIVDHQTFIHTKSPRKIPIRLSTDKTIVGVCGFSEKLSCCDMSTKQCWINFYRWKNGSKHSGLPLHKYKNYVINHEVGHALGRLHSDCECDGCSAPIMMQQTKGIGSCKPNDKPLIGE